MHDITLLATAVQHQVCGLVRPGDDRAAPTRDRGAVSLEQVLWFVAAGVSVVVIAAILWNQIRDTANTTPTPPTAPTP